MYYVDIYAAQHYTDRNLEQSGRSERKRFRIFLKFTLKVGFNCWCLSEISQEYYCLYSHLIFVSAELTSLVFTNNNFTLYSLPPPPVPHLLGDNDRSCSLGKCV